MIVVHPTDARRFVSNVEATAPAEEPITVAQAKAHARIDGSGEDPEITAKIIEARTMVEGIIGRPLVTRSFRLRRCGFPAGRYFLLPSARASAVSSITYVDSNGSTQTLASNQYTLDADSIPGVVRLANGVTSWPATLATEDLLQPTVTVVYAAGWASAAALPASLVAAVKLAFGHLWDGAREAAGERPLREHDHSITALCAPFMVAGV